MRSSGRAAREASDAKWKDRHGMETRSRVFPPRSLRTKCKVQELIRRSWDVQATAVSSVNRTEGGKDEGNRALCAEGSFASSYKWQCQRKEVQKRKAEVRPLGRRGHSFEPKEKEKDVN